MEVETAGFKRTSVTDVELTAATPATVSITLEPGAATETVEIKATAPTVEDDNAELSLGLDTRPVRQYPVVDRNHQELNGLASGVTPPLASLDAANDPEQNRFYNVNGQSSLINRHYLDGVVNFEPFRGTAIRIAPSETIQQMSIRTGTYSARHGFAGPGLTNIVTRGGTNSWHGSLFEFHSNDELNAQKWFSPFRSSGLFDDDLFDDENDTDSTNLVYNQFGGTIGGPIRRDSTFFFGSYEGTYQRDHTPTFATVPTGDMRAGNFSNIPGLNLFNPRTGQRFANNRIPSAQINPFSQSIVNSLPAPNMPGFVNNYVAPSYLRRDGNRFDGRIDQHFGDRTSAFVRYGYSNWGVVDESILGNLLGGGSTTRLVAQNAIASVIHNWSPRLNMEARLGYNRYKQRMSSRNFESPLGLGFTDLPGIQIAGMQQFGENSNLPMRAVDNTFNLTNGWTLNTGMHNVSFGAEIRRLHADGWRDLAFGPTGTAIFGAGPTSASPYGLSDAGSFPNAFASFLVGAPTQIGATDYLVTPAIRQWKFAGYVEDKIRIFRRVHLNFGVRYDVFSPLEPEDEGGAMFFDPMSNAFQFAGIGGVDRTQQAWDINNFAPRIGLAFGVDEKTVIRGGYALNYFQVPYRLAGFTASQFGQVMGVAGGQQAATTAFAPNAFPTITAPTQLGNNMAAGNLPAVLHNEDQITPYVQQYHLQIQRELGASTVFKLGYVGTLGRQLPFLNQLNVGAPGTGLAGMPFFGQFGRTASTARYDYGLTNNYNSLQANLSKRFARGLSFQGAYTWGKAQDYASDFNPLLNPFSREANYAVADYDRQHTLSIAHLWEIPVGPGYSIANSGMMSQILGGWQINGMFRWATGTPFNVLADPLACACPGVTAVTANVLQANPEIANDPGPNRRLFNPAMFGQPAGGFGNLGRNALRGPGFKNYDLSLFKAFPIRERYKMELRGAAYNLTNTPHFSNPVTYLGSPAFGQVTETLPGVDGALNNNGGRVVTVGLRVLF